MATVSPASFSALPTALAAPSSITILSDAIVRACQAELGICTLIDREVELSVSKLRGQEAIFMVKAAFKAPHSACH